MNNKGYMLYELIIAFVLASIISIFLLSTAFKLSDKNSELTIESKISVIEEDYTARFYKDIESHMQIYFIGALDQEDTSYCTFLMDSEEVHFGIDKSKKTIYYNDYATKLPDGIEAVSINCGSTYNGEGYDNSIFHTIGENKNNTAISINIKLNDNYKNKDYNINILHLYKDPVVNYEI